MAPYDPFPAEAPATRRFPTDATRTRRWHQITAEWGQRAELRLWGGAAAAAFPGA